MSDATRRNCGICARHYLLVREDTYHPACSCEAEAARAERTRTLVETARGPLHDALWGIGQLMLEGRAAAG